MKLNRQKTMYEHQDTKDHQNMSQSSSFSCEFLKKFTRIALSFSLFSFIFLQPSWFSHFIQSFISHLYKNPSQVLSIVTDKNYIFLLCNGILVFIAKYSSKKFDNHPSPQPTEMVISTPENDFIFRNYPPQTLASLMEKSIVGEDVEEEVKEMRLLEGSEGKLEEENAQFLITDGRERGEVDGGSIFGDDDYNNNNNNSQHVSCYHGMRGDTDVTTLSLRRLVPKDLQEEEEEEEEGIAKMSTEELNRKFEEFIRKMKEELRIEAQQQLIMV